jgi:peroxiredoxin (alkyl hydroperoxide reductase subunit C)
MEQSSETKAVSIPRIGDKAPDFKAVTTQARSISVRLRGELGDPFQPSCDFTPVCTLKSSPSRRWKGSLASEL